LDLAGRRLTTDCTDNTDEEEAPLIIRKSVASGRVGRRLTTDCTDGTDEEDAPLSIREIRAIRGQKTPWNASAKWSITTTNRCHPAGLEGG
jgi:hypothetical protein